MDNLQVKTRPLEDLQYAIGDTPSNLTLLRRAMIPTPDQVVYKAASVYYVRGDGSRVGDGYTSVGWIWDVISTQKLSYLMTYLNGAEWKYVYIRTDVRDGTYSNPRSAFNVYYAMMLKPILDGVEGVPIARSPYAMQTVRVLFKNLVLQPGYL